MACRLEQGIGSKTDVWPSLQADYDLAGLRRQAGAIAVRKPVACRHPTPPDAIPA